MTVNGFFMNVAAGRFSSETSSHQRLGTLGNTNGTIVKNVAGTSDILST